MGIINVTPDSFSDAGALLDAGRAVEAGVQMVEEGADLLDVGGNRRVRVRCRWRKQTNGGVCCR